MQTGWSQILIGGILGAGLWSGVAGLTSSASSPATAAVVQVEESPADPPAMADATPEPTPSRPVVEESPIAATPSPAPAGPTPSATPAPVVEAAPPPVLPILRGTLVGSAHCAILEYQGNQRMVREGEAIGPFVVGGVYPKQASVSLKGEKYFLSLVPQISPVAPTPAPSKSENSTEQWIKSLSVTQVERDGMPVGLLIHRSGVAVANPQEGPLSQYGIYDSDVIKAINGHPLHSQADLWWLHQELLHATNLQISMERGGIDQTLKENI